MVQSLRLSPVDGDNLGSGLSSVPSEWCDSDKGFDLSIPVSHLSAGGL